MSVGIGRNQGHTYGQGRLLRTPLGKPGVQKCLTYFTDHSSTSKHIEKQQKGTY